VLCSGWCSGPGKRLYRHHGSGMHPRRWLSLRENKARQQPKPHVKSKLMSNHKVKFRS
jgi:hypothetical protein